MQKRWIPRWGWHTLLALMMLLMQQAGLRHGLLHASRNDSAPTHTVCLECLAHHASDHSVAPTVPQLMAATVVHVLAATLGQAQLGDRFLAGYLSRAPPVLFG
jgi:hypothetical protein